MANYTLDSRVQLPLRAFIDVPEDLREPFRLLRDAVELLAQTGDDDAASIAEYLALLASTRVVTASTTLQTSDGSLEVAMPSSTPIVIDLGDAAEFVTRATPVKIIAATVLGSLTVHSTVSALQGGANSIYLLQGDSLQLKATDSGWWIV